MPMGASRRGTLIVSEHRMAPTRKTTTGFASNPSAQAALAAFGFPAFRIVPENGQLASVLPTSWQSGIYVFECEDGEGYVGQTIGLLSTRLSDHRKKVAGIRAVTFLQTSRAQLNQRERDVHAMLERAGVRMKNVSFARLEPTTSLRFVDVLPVADQQRWLAEPLLIVDDDRRPMTDERTSRGDALFRDFEQHFASVWMLRALGRYVWRTIPNPRMSERTYWSVTLKLHSGEESFLRLNVGAQAVLDLMGYPGWRTSVRVYAPRERFERAFGMVLPTRTPAHNPFEMLPLTQDPDFAALGCVPSGLVEAGPDQFEVIGPCEPMMALFESEAWIREARAMHLDMMQRRKGINGRSHNTAVGDAILEVDVEQLLRS